MTSEKPAAPDTEGPYKVERVSSWWNVTGPDRWISSYHSLKRARHDAHRLNFGYRAGQLAERAKWNQKCWSVDQLRSVPCVRDHD